MELISAYLYNQIPFQTIGIAPKSLNNLISIGWVEDDRKSAAYAIVHRRLKIKEQYYKMTLRFRRRDNDTLELDTPAPFMIVLSDLNDDGVRPRFVDTSVHHSKQVKTVAGYFEKGIPPELIEALHFELRFCLSYKKEEPVVIGVDWGK